MCSSYGRKCPYCHEPLRGGVTLKIPRRWKIWRRRNRKVCPFCYTEVSEKQYDATNGSGR